MSDGSPPHWRALEQMYLGAPINAFYQPRIEVSEEKAVIEIDIGHHFFHPAGAVHGSVYFKMLDDAAFFAPGPLPPNKRARTSRRRAAGARHWTTTCVPRWSRLLTPILAACACTPTARPIR